MKRFVLILGLIFSGSVTADSYNIWLEKYERVDSILREVPDPENEEAY